MIKAQALRTDNEDSYSSFILRHSSFVIRHSRAARHPLRGPTGNSPLPDKAIAIGRDSGK